MIDVRAVIGIVIFTVVETAWIALVLIGADLVSLADLFANPLIAAAAFLVLLEEHFIAHNVGQGDSFPEYLGLPTKDR